MHQTNYLWTILLKKDLNILKYRNASIEMSRETKKINLLKALILQLPMQRRDLQAVPKE